MKGRYKTNNKSLVAKFVVSRCKFANLEWAFLFRQSFEWGRTEVNANHNAKHSPLTKTENDSRLLKNSEGNRDDEWTFCLGQETRIRMIRKIFEEN